VCLSKAACPRYCTDPDVTWGSGRRCPLVVHYWADLQSVHRLRCYVTLWKCVAEPSVNPSGSPHACRTRTLCMPAKTPLASDKMNAPAVCTVPFRFHCGGIVTRMQNVSEYMLVLTLCLVYICTYVFGITFLEHSVYTTYQMPVACMCRNCCYQPSVRLF